MLDEKVISEIEKVAGRAGARQAPMERFTSFGCGGPAALMIEADDAGRLAAILHIVESAGIPWSVVGKGTNLLVADAGFPGLVISMTGPLKECRIQGNILVCGAGVLLPRAASVAAENGLTGLEPLALIPGTLGGAVVMNAGAFGSEIGDLVEWLAVCVPGECRKLDRSVLSFGYRRSNITSRTVVNTVALGLKPDDPEKIRKRMNDFRKRREAAQPGGRTFGSVFKNPPGESAGRLLEKSGCKKLAAGGAAVSEEHANFIVNKGKATTADVVELMNRCRRQVKDKFGVVLEPEVRFLGDISLEAL